MIRAPQERGYPRMTPPQSLSTMHFPSVARARSHMNLTEVYLIAMMLIFGVPYLVWRVGRTDYWAPLVVVQIVTGILLGPGVLGSFFPGFHSHVFTPQVILTLNGVAWWAVMIFVWLAGIELDLGSFWAARRDSLITAGLALAMPLALGAGAALLMLAGSSDWMGEAAQKWQFVLGIGMACAVTALPILVLLMERMQLLRTLLGQRVLRYASLDDIAIWAVLALILLDWERVGRQAAFLVGFALATALFRALLRRLETQDRWYVSLLWLASSGLAADWAGLHYMVGAFLAGAVTDTVWLGRAQVDALRHHVLLVMMPVFFLSTGLRTTWSLGGSAVFGAAALLLTAAVVGKLFGVHLAGRWLGWRAGEAKLIGWLLQTKALIMIIFANVLLDRQIIAASTFTALLLMAVASTMLTVPVVTPILGRQQECGGQK